ncbi:MAG: CRISPR-associated endonuclease Cas2 [Candidatus Brocadia carolinensis]|uniref:CRISPR-associated endoribonuclease Cas2 n=1 Tax=Candidatus Brocadia carolinensis TaxID=1004156 RepID=A0A1V4APP4_9BACT|nr:MAG: CRISPR-associated endonuclease Cas2 [Candidatus Brocadia caroliniensis]
MRGVSDYAVVYDITSDAERGKVDKVLKGFGFRIQKSIFECRLNKRGRNELIDRLEKLQIKTGFIKVYRLEYSSKDTVIGQQKKADIDDGHAFII